MRDLRLGRAEGCLARGQLELPCCADNLCRALQGGPNGRLRRPADFAATVVQRPYRR